MRRLLSWRLMAMVITLIAALSPFSLPAQSIGLDKIIALEISKPTFDETFFNTTFPTSTMFLSLRYPAAEKVLLVTEIPFAHGGIDFTVGPPELESLSDRTIGNPYLGAEVHGKNFPVFAEIGVRVPMVQTHNIGTAIGALTELVDRFEAFTPNYFFILGMANWRYRSSKGFAIRLRGGPSFWINTKNDGNDGTELFLLYSAQAGYESERVHVGGSVGGRWFLTVENGDFGERTLHQLGLAASVGLGKAWPGVQIKLPLDNDLEQIWDFIIGVNLGIQLE